MTDIPDENLPQTETVLDQPAMEFDSHKWQQQGYTLVDVCGTHPSQGIAIEYGKCLIKQGGHYTLVDEVR